MATLGSLEQWRLLEGVCPLFECGIPWTSRTKRPVDELVIKNTATLFKTGLRNLRLVGRPDGFIPEDKRLDVDYQIDSLLFQLETLLQSSVKVASEGLEKCSDDESEDTIYTGDVATRYPKLVALHKYVDHHRTTISTMDPSQLVCLDQDAVKFKKVYYGITVCLKTIEGVNNQDSRDLASPAQQSRARAGVSQLSSSFQTHSRRLFGSLVGHISPCVSRGARHEAMLQLKYLEHRGDPIQSPELSLLLALCPDQGLWQQTQCSELQDQEEDEDCIEEVRVGHLCSHAKIAHDNNQIFRIQLGVDRVLDASDDAYRPDNPGATPIVSLSDLVAKGLFKDQSKVFPDDKRVLAYTLGHALLNLYESDWLQRLWTLENIFLPFVADTNMVYNIHQPYIVCSLSMERPALGTLDALHKYPLILSFAKLLWEIETGEQVHQQTWRKYKNGQPSLWWTLKGYFKTDAKLRVIGGYRKAIEACLDFSARFERERNRNSTTTVQHAILKYIVHELETEVYLDERNERWGKCNIGLPAAYAISTRVSGDRDKASSLDMSPGRAASPTGTAASFRQNPPRTSRVVAVPVKHGAITKPIQDTAAGLGITRPSTRGSPSNKLPASRRPPLRPNHTAHKPPLPARGVSDNQKTTQKHRKQSRVVQRTHGNNRSTLPSPPLPGRSVSPIPVHGRSSESEDDGKQDSPSRNTNNKVIKVKSGFGHTRLFSCTDASVQISAETFDYLNKTVDEYWQHWEKDKAIKVAILDTGIDIEHADFKRARTKTFTGPQRNIPNPPEGETAQKARIIACNNFCPGQEETDVSDVDGHGTQVAGIILRLAPHAQLYIARICAGDANRGLPPEKQVSMERKIYDTPQPEIVERAIEWALEIGVDIINMSLGFRNCPETKLKGVRRALEKAQEQKVVVFAATSNEGLHEPVAWPACDRQYALGIHSCGDSGRKASDFNALPSIHGENFMVVGENILSQWPTDKGGGFRVATGTSFAAPVASAIGVLILQFTRQKLCKLHHQSVGKLIRLEDLWTNVGMMKVLRAISTLVDDEFWSISPKLFWRDALPSGRDKIQQAWDVIEVALQVS
ncbi:hypothetical protein QBC37DRAFT_434803 [Rhypophila decipiens]|uniref:Peptidase S8/S53 domain-containing protein n=1 Tax=Rhypophila decipiens TaxID=261697 RepID=A0AAN6XTW6_9PEZI|nr:hypothetical protein QBC37DRAFT_434803 [Rhypophila decipiens]